MTGDKLWETHIWCGVPIKATRMSWVVHISVLVNISHKFTLCLRVIVTIMIYCHLLKNHSSISLLRKLSEFWENLEDLSFHYCIPVSELNLHARGVMINSRGVRMQVCFLRVSSSVFKKNYRKRIFKTSLWTIFFSWTINCDTFVSYKYNNESFIPMVNHGNCTRGIVFFPLEELEGQRPGAKNLE